MFSFLRIDSRAVAALVKLLVSFRVLADDRGTVKCLLCIKYNKKNTFVSGYNSGKLHDVKRHLGSNDHQTALEAYKATKHGQTLTHVIRRSITGENVQFKCFVPYCNNAYFIAKFRRPFTDFGPQCCLARMNGSGSIGANLYHNEKAGKEIIEAIDTVLETRLREKLNGNAMPIGLQMDESTSFRNKHLIVYVTYIDEETWLPKTE